MLLLQTSLYIHTIYMNKTVVKALITSWIGPIANLRRLFIAEDKSPSIGRGSDIIQYLGSRLFEIKE
jgi:hypothetical protein